MFKDEEWTKPDHFDITDNNKLAQFQIKLRRWKNILAGKDSHSIENQLVDLCWNDTIYRSYNEALRLRGRRVHILPFPALSNNIYPIPTSLL